MAGDWIKITHGIHSKPEVFGISRILGMCPDEVVGYLCRFWVWADCNTVDGHVDHMTSTDVDAVVDRVGFGDALVSVSWLLVDASGVGFTIPNFSSHNGDSAKKRVLKTKAQAKWRSGNVDSSVDNDVDTPLATGASTREEKSREELTALTEAHSSQVELNPKNLKPTVSKVNGGKSERIAQQFPDGFVLTPELRKFALDRLPADTDVDALWEHFEAHHRKSGVTFKSWEQAWTTWIHNAKKFGPPKLKGEDSHRDLVTKARRMFINSEPGIIPPPHVQESSDTRQASYNVFLVGEAINPLENDCGLTMREGETF